MLLGSGWSTHPENTKYSLSWCFFPDSNALRKHKDEHQCGFLGTKRKACSLPQHL